MSKHLTTEFNKALEEFVLQPEGFHTYDLVLLCHEYFQKVRREERVRSVNAIEDWYTLPPTERRKKKLIHMIIKNYD